MEGWVELGDGCSCTYLVVYLQTVTHPSINHLRATRPSIEPTTFRSLRHQAAYLFTYWFRRTLIIHWCGWCVDSGVHRLHEECPSADCRAESCQSGSQSARCRTVSGRLQPGRLVSTRRGRWNSLSTWRPMHVGLASRRLPVHRRLCRTVLWNAFVSLRPVLCVVVDELNVIIIVVCLMHRNNKLQLLALKCN